MIYLIEVRTKQGSLLSLPLDDVSSGFVVEEVEGLDPVKATIVSSGFATLNGVQYQSSRREQRDLKLTIGLEPDYVNNTVALLRKQLYAYFMPQSEVSLRFFDTDGLVVDISGMVESCDAAQFTEEPTMIVAISCFNPDFVDVLNPEQITGNTVSNETEILVEYTGSLETGIEFTLNVDRTLTEFTIYHRPSDGSIRSLDFAAPLEAGDIVRISTVPGSKGATLTHLGSESSVLYGISPQSNWLELLPGTNYLRVYAVGLPIPFTIDYTNKYGGL